LKYQTKEQIFNSHSYQTAGPVASVNNSTAKIFLSGQSIGDDEEEVIEVAVVTVRLRVMGFSCPLGKLSVTAPNPFTHSRQPIARQQLGTVVKDGRF